MKDINWTLESHGIPSQSQYFRQIFGGVALGINNISGEFRAEVMNGIKSGDPEVEKMIVAGMHQIATPIAFAVGGGNQFNPEECYKQMLAILIDVFEDEIQEAN